MARSMITIQLLVIVLLAAEVHTAYGDYGDYGGGYYPPGPPGGPWPPQPGDGQYGHTPDSVNITTLSGTARFLGPLSAGCTVTYSYWGQEANLTSVTTLGGFLTAPPGVEIEIGTCKDTFTGVDVPYNLTGFSRNSSFFITPTTIIAAASSIDFNNVSDIAPGFVSYSQLGLNGTTAFVSDMVDTYARLRAGAVNASLFTLVTDLKFVALGSLVSSAVWQATDSVGTETCVSRTDLVFAIANWVSSRNFPVFGNAEDVREVLYALSEWPCMVPQNITSTLAGGTLPALVQGVTAELDAVRPRFGPLFTVSQLARWSAVLSTTPFTSSLTVPLLKGAVNSTSSIVPSAIAASLGITYSSVDTSVSVSMTGPLAGVALQYRPFSALVPVFTDLTNANGVVSVAGATFGLYTVPAGATDVFLSTENQTVRTLVPFTAVAGFTSSSNRKLALAPVGALVLVKWLKTANTDSTALTVPGPADFRAAYESIAGSLPNADYMARDYTAGSGTALAVFAVDIILPAIPSLGGSFVARALSADPLEVYMYTVMLLESEPASSYTSSSRIAAVLKAAYTHFSPPSSRRRALLQTAELDQLLNSISSSISASNALVQTVLEAAAQSISSGVAPSTSAFVTVTQVAQVQTTAIAAQIQEVAALIQSGDLTAAVSKANEVAAAYTGEALASAVAAAQVNTRAIEISVTNTNTTVDEPAPAPSDDNRDRSLAIGLGVGLGVGLTVLIIAGVAGFIYISRHQAYNEAPGGGNTYTSAPTAEGTERSDATTSQSELPQQQQVDESGASDDNAV